MEFPRIIVVASDDSVRGELAHLFERRGHEPVPCNNLSSSLGELREGGCDLFLLSLPQEAMLGRHALEALRVEAPITPIVVAGCDTSIPGPAEAFDCGAYEFFSEPLPDPQRLLAAIGLALGVRRHDSQLNYLRRRDSEEADLSAIIGSSEVMHRLKEKIQQIVSRVGSGKAPPILLMGETGTGKGLLAKSIHYGSARRNGPFVSVNCAAIPHNLLESELFGHVRGAFTDAHATKQGLFETADGGTLFLDEITSIPLSLQPKLLTACEEQRVRRVGANRSVEVDVQIIAATHEDLPERVSSGQFRQDLYHRLNVLVIELPPLRHRGPDTLVLAERFIVKACSEYGLPMRELSPAARRALQKYQWPGNVRELKNQIERAVLLGDDGVITPSDFQLAHEDVLSVDTSNADLRIRLPTGGLALEAIERAILVEALRKNKGNVSKTARFLSISRQKLIYRMKKHNVSSGGADS